MKKIGFFLFLIISFIAPVFADYGLTFEQFLTTYIDTVVQTKRLPSSYQYIQLKYPNISNQDSIYFVLQKAVYLDIFPNASVALPLDKYITQGQAMSIISQTFDIQVSIDKNLFVTSDWLRPILQQIQSKNQNSGSVSIITSPNIPVVTSPLFVDVYSKLHTNYVSDSGLDEKNLLYGAVKGLVEGVNDPYSAFFPPVEAQSLTDELQGEYYGIGAYVEMNTPGELVIISPIKNSPAEKIGLLGGDRIVQIEDTIIKEDMSINTATSLIKGPAGTTVSLKVLRNGKILDFTVTRQKIVITNVEPTLYPIKGGNICLVTIAMFDFGVSDLFQTTMDNLAKQRCVKYIFDVRNNPGGGLNEVAHMLNYFVPTGEISVIIKSKFVTEEVKAWKSSFKITKTPVRILINQGSASASEIFAGTIKDYLSGALLVGEKSFGKGSVQELLNYDDGSMLKYTVAKWYTGKSKKNIDKIGISPDKMIEDKKDTPEDEVLQWAIKN